jgi:4,5-dihydroxyphthalate decarboxylase
VEGCDVNVIAMDSAELFFRAFRYKEWDVCELSFSSYLRTVDGGNAAYIAIPAFVSRAFRHSSLYIRTDRGIEKPADLRGKKVGVPEYQMTGSVWMRAVLEEEYQVRPCEIHWLTGGQEEPGRGERTPLAEIKGINLQRISPRKTLSAMLEAGELDALLCAQPPSCFLRAAPNVGRIFPNYKSTEQAYYKKTKLFPIMHLIGVRRSLVDKYPWLPSSVYKAFCEAKEIAMRRLRDLTVLAVSLPWMEVEARETSNLMGDDFWSYGVAENQKEIEAITRYSYEQGLTSRSLRLNELFAESTFENSRI